MYSEIYFNRKDSFIEKKLRKGTTQGFIVFGYIEKILQPNRLNRENMGGVNDESVPVLPHSNTPSKLSHAL